MRWFALFLCTAVAFAQNWPSFRGPGAAGVADGMNPPLSWDLESGRNVAWKTAVPGLAHSSPIVWGERIYLTTAVSSDLNTAFQFPLKGELDRRTDTSKHQFRVLAIDKNNGKIVWNSLAYDGPPRIARHPHSSYGAATAATDGKHLIAFFGSEGLYGFDLDGKLLWKQDVGVLDQGAFDVPDYKWGYASSPILYKNLAIVQCDQQKGSFLAAFDADTGKPLWKTLREALPAWSTPGIYEGKTGAELITNGTEYIRGYDPLTGKEQWKLKGTSMISVPTPFVAHDLIFVASGYWRFIQPVYAIRPGARGDITLAKDTTTNESICWSQPKGASYLSTPLVYVDLLYVIGGNGVLTVSRALTGERVYQQRVAQGPYFTASPVAADGRVYFADEDGDVFVVKAGPQYDLLATNHLGEVAMATPAVTKGMLIFRTLHQVVGIR